MAHSTAAVLFGIAVLVILAVALRKRKGTGPADAPVDYGPDA